MWNLNWKTCYILIIKLLIYSFKKIGKKVGGATKLIVFGGVSLQFKFEVDMMATNGCVD